MEQLGDEVCRKASLPSRGRDVDAVPDDCVPMAKKYIDINMACLAFAEERGSWQAVSRFLNGSNFARIEKFANPELKKTIAAARERLRIAEKYESIHGKGSLLLRDHPFNVRIEKIFREHKNKNK